MTKAKHRVIRALERAWHKYHRVTRTHIDVCQLIALADGLVADKKTRRAVMTFAAETDQREA